MINFTKKKFINLGKLRNEDKRPSLWSTVESDQVEVIGGRVTGIKHALTNIISLLQNLAAF